MVNVPEDWRERLVKVGKGALIAGAAAALTYLVQWASGQDLGVYGPLVVSILSVLINFLRKFEPAIRLRKTP